MKKYFKDLTYILLTSFSSIEFSLFLPLLFHKFLMTIVVAGVLFKKLDICIYTDINLLRIQTWVDIVILTASS